MTKELREKLKGKKILFACVAAVGHFNPLTGLAKLLQEMGCDIRWYTSTLFTEKLEKLGIPHYPYVQAEDVNSDGYRKFQEERKLIRDVTERLNYDIISIFVGRAPGFYKDIQSLYLDFPFEAMVADSTFAGIPYVRFVMNLPAIGIGIIPLAEESVDLAPYGRGLHPVANEAQKSQYAEMRMQIIDAFKPSIDVFGALLDRYDIPHKNTSYLDQLIHLSTLYLQIGVPSFEYTRSDLGNNIRFVGALSAYVSAGQNKTWVDERLKMYKKIILVTQGTVEKDVQKLLVPTLEAFKGTDVLVVATTGGNQTEELKGKYPFPNIIIEDYIPFDEIMPYAHVYVTNGGYGGTLMGIKYGLPMVVAGVHEGKLEVCSRVGYFNMGINLATETPTLTAIADAVNKIFNDGRYKDSVNRLAKELEGYNANELSAEYIAELL